ncbi:MAG TPA: hypothetical protein PK760_03080, partial [Flavobacteriales bacterium]|nr:hypothetical protein [Flavobacteriales bacterium]
MKLSTLVIALAIPSFTFAQTAVTVTTAPGNAQQTYYSLENGVVSSPALAEWDLAFEVVGISGSIMANNAKGMLVYKTPYTVADWALVDTTGLAATWPAQYNSETDWSDGAFNHGHGGGMFDLGWGIYNPVTHNIAGDSCFVIKLADGSWKKFRMDGYAALTDAFSFTWADLD